MISLSALPLNALRAVEAVGRLGSLLAASEELNITPSAVSQHVQKAEERLGVALFDRAKGSLVPTSKGRALLPRLASGFAEIVEGVSSIQAADDNVLTVTMGPALASGWFMPRLSRFAAAHPETQLRLVANTALFDLKRSDIDVAIRLGSGSWPGLMSEHLLDQSVFPVVAPMWTSKLKRPSDLAQLPLIQEENAVIGWREWFAKTGIEPPLEPRGPVFNDPVLAFDAALSGQGAMLAWSLIATDALSDGRLVRPFEHSVATDSAYWLVTTRDGRRRAKVKSFRQWLFEEMKPNS